MNRNDLLQNNIDNMEPFKGCVFDKIEGTENGSEQLSFYENGVERFRMYHSLDCCESVSLEDVCGDINDLIGSPIVEAEVVTDTNSPKVEKYGDSEYADESSTWTFYKLRTIKGGVTIRWYGSSNGYYSEAVELADMHKDNPNQ